MSARRLFALLALGLLFAVPVSAQRRRAVRFPGPVAPAPQCHTFGFVRAGLKATYHSVAPGGTVDFTVTYISDTPTQTRTTQKVTTAQGNADVETTLDGEIVGILRALKHIYLKTTSVVPVLGNVVTETDIDFVPSLAAGPAAGWCTGATWTISPVTETVVTRSSLGTQTTVITTIVSQGEVLSVNESITVPGGTFNTVKHRGAIVSGESVQPAITWISKEHNIVVKQDTLDASGNVTSTTQLTALQ